MSYAEVHFHLLPGIDDGPSSIEESIALAFAAAAEGTRTIVATPHVHPQHVTDPTTLPDRVHEVRAALAGSRINVDVRCGGELDIELVARLSDDQLATIAQGPTHHRWLLLEAPLVRGLDDSYTAAADELRARGFAVVVAHPERALDCTEAGWRALEHELAAGSPLQVNAWSVAGFYGEQVRNIALGLLKRARCAVLASDAHGGSRMPALKLALDALAASGIENPTRFLAAGPNALLERGVDAGRGALAA